MSVSPVSIRRKPQGAPNLSNGIPLVLLPALAQLRQAKTGADALWEINALPDQLLPEIAAEMATRESLFEPAVIRTVLECVGFNRLAEHVGVQRATAIVARHCI